MENTIKLQDLLARCSEFLNGMIGQEELSDAVKNLQLRYFIPMNEKVKIIQDILYETNFNIESLENKIRDLEVAKILKGFLAYFTNLEYEKIDYELINNCDIYTYETLYVVLYIGSPELVKLIEKDYSTLCNMIDSIVLQGDISQVLSIFEDLDFSELAKENKKLRRSFKEITTTNEGQKAISDLLEIARFNDPTMKKIIEEEARENIKNKTNSKSKKK